MKKFKSLIILLILSNYGIAQNLIQNGNFDSTYQGAFNVTKAYFWNSPTDGNPDIFSPNSINIFDSPLNIVGYQIPKSGDTYFGLIAYSKNTQKYREYGQSELRSILKKDSTYCFQMYISLADSCQYAAKNNLGIYFSQTETSSSTREELPLIPQIEFIDTTYFIERKDWVKLETSYTATGGEKFIIIGNFRNDSLTDTLRIQGGNKTEHEGIYYYIDNVYLGNCDSVPIDTGVGIAEHELRSKLKVYPNPTKNLFNLQYKGQQQLSFELYSILGEKLFTRFVNQGNSFQFSIGDLPKGIYFLNVFGIAERTTFKIVKE